jgi:hypothetical protein
LMTVWIIALFLLASIGWLMLMMVALLHSA